MIRYLIVFLSVLYLCSGHFNIKCFNIEISFQKLHSFIYQISYKKLKEIFRKEFSLSGLKSEQHIKRNEQTQVIGFVCMCVFIQMVDGGCYR